MQSILEELKSLASVNLFKDGRDQNMFVGRPFYFDYERVKLLVNDKWKHKVGGLPVGSFLVCAYDAEPDVEEMVLLRVLRPSSLPTDSEVVASMVEYYKEGAADTPKTGKIDSYTRYEFMFSGLECRVLGTFYRNIDKRVVFGADVENFFSAHNYSVYKASSRVLEYVVNFREGGIPGGQDQVRIGNVRYSSARRHVNSDAVPVYVSAMDFIGKRTALFGMTRTGKSNTVKKLIEAVISMSDRANPDHPDVKAPVGQIIFDINGEYANPNPQDQGTAISEIYEDRTLRYSLLEKPGFKVMKLNFYRELQAGLDMIGLTLNQEERGSDYVKNFLAIDLAEPTDGDQSSKVRWSRLVAVYRACLFAAGFPMDARIKFDGQKDLNELGGFDPSAGNGLTGDQAVSWFTSVWEHYDSCDYIKKYPKTHDGREWADVNLKAALVMLTRKKQGSANASVSGYLKLRQMLPYHTQQSKQPFETEILDALRGGKIVIIDLSQGDPNVQRTFSERISKAIFQEVMNHFIKNEPANFVQFYFEEAHNLFPKKEDKDLSQIYNRIAKEGAKLRLGLVYATQEVSSISSNVLKNTQNWFVSHLNNSDELREIEKYYDYEDFIDSLLRTADRGFIRMKTYTNPFVVPVQIDRFEKKGGA